MGGIVVTYSCRDVCGLIDEFAPTRYTLEGDPVGLSLGGDEMDVKKLFVALELTPAVLAEAVSYGADMIFVHHTPFYYPLSCLREDDPRSGILLELIRKNIALYTAHSNLDNVRGGTSDVLAEILDITQTDVLRPVSSRVTEAGSGRVGTLRKPVILSDFAQMVAARLSSGRARFVGEGDRMLRRAACCGGSGSFLIQDAIDQGADVYVTADIKHHDAAMAAESGLALVDPGHFASENPVIRVLAAYIGKKAPGLDVMISGINTDPFKYT
jgi:dinuclear metal center YbgI/SA1388 family protein